MTRQDKITFAATAITVVGSLALFTAMKLKARKLDREAASKAEETPAPIAS